MAKFDSSLDTAFQTFLRHMHEFLDPMIVPLVDSAELVGLILPLTRDFIWLHSIDQSMHLESVTAHIRTFPPDYPASLFLFLFFDTLRARLPSRSRDGPQRNSATLIIVCTLLKQMCQALCQSQLNTEALLDGFMLVLVEHNRAVFTRPLKDPQTLLDDLFSQATAETLWIALGSTLIKLFKTVELRNDDMQAAYVTLIFDTHDERTQEVEHLLQAARKMATDIEREKILVDIIVTSNVCQSVDGFASPPAAIPEASIVYEEEGRTTFSKDHASDSVALDNID